MQDDKPLPEPLYTAEQSQELDRTAIEEYGIPGITLMQRAGQAAFTLLREVWPDEEEITVLSGTGNNGGDGFAIASLARQHQLSVRVLLVGATGKIAGDARKAYDAALLDGVTVEAFKGSETLGSGVIVDALLGTGLAGDVRSDHQQAIDLINNSKLPVLAIDIPSGLCSDTGRVLGRAVKAEHTVTFIGLKQGLLTARGPAYCGHVHFAGLQVPDPIYQRVPSHCLRYDLASLGCVMPVRPRDAHKGMYGHVLVVGGDEGMPGAVAMACEAAVRIGAGLVSVATRPEHISALVSRRPEVMVHGVRSGQELEPLLERPSVIVIGPGLGRSAWSEQLLQKVVQTQCPLVVDADALNILCEGRVIPKPGRDNWVLTPHPGEAARLLDTSTEDIQADRFKAVKKIQRQYGGVAVLKGAGSLIAADNVLHLCHLGNPGMASGGMGDVLSGVIGGLLAQGLTPAMAARAGVALHARAADLVAATEGECGLLATDLIMCMKHLVNGKVN